MSSTSRQRSRPEGVGSGRAGQQGHAQPMASSPLTSDRGPVETFTSAIRHRFPEARFAFDYSSSFKWFDDPEPLTFDELAGLGVRFLFITLGGQHAAGHGLATLLAAMADRRKLGYIELQRREWASVADIPTRSHHQFSGVPYDHLVGRAYDAPRLGEQFADDLPDDRVV